VLDPQVSARAQLQTLDGCRLRLFVVLVYSEFSITMKPPDFVTSHLENFSRKCDLIIGYRNQHQNDDITSVEIYDFLLLKSR
jgi:hypothetical protein